MRSERSGCRFGGQCIQISGRINRDTLRVVKTITAEVRFAGGKAAALPEHQVGRLACAKAALEGLAVFEHAIIVGVGDVKVAGPIDRQTLRKA